VNLLHEITRGRGDANGEVVNSRHAAVAFQTGLSPFNGPAVELDSGRQSAVHQFPKIRFWRLRQERASGRDGLEIIRVQANVILNIRKAYLMQLRLSQRVGLRLGVRVQLRQTGEADARRWIPRRHGECERVSVRTK